MKRSDSMLARVEEYLRYRRALGYALRIEGGMLLNFARFADKGRHRGPLTCDLATRWARLPAVGLLLASFSVYATGGIKTILIFAGFMLFNFMTNLGPNVGAAVYTGLRIVEALIVIPFGTRPHGLMRVVRLNRPMLRAWTDQYEDWIQVRSDLAVAIDEALIRENIAVA
jgi:hypothetical protein